MSAFYLPLCVPQQYFHFTFGTDLRNSLGKGWRVDSPDIEFDLLAAISTDGRGFLEGLRSPLDVAMATRLRYERDRNPHACEAAT